MATVTAVQQLNMVDLNFNRVYAGAYDSYVFKDITFNNIFYPNVFEVPWTQSGYYFYSAFGARDLTYIDQGAAGKVITGGTATAYLEMIWNGKAYDPAFLVEGINVPAATLYNTFTTPTTTDDVAIISQALSGNDKLFGSTSSDVLAGYAGNDSYYGAQGDDMLINFIQGGGIDRSFYSGSSAQYSVARNGSSVNIFDSVTNRDGSDTLVNVDRAAFTDCILAFDISGDAGKAYRLYQAALDRTPDGNGLGGWIKYLDEGYSLTSAAQQFIDSSEFKIKYGALDDRAFVNQLYLNVLDRNGEAAGINGWVDGMAHGLSRAQVLEGFSESAENQARVLPQIQNGIKYNEWWLA
jgi:serralysin